MFQRAELEKDNAKRPNITLRRVWLALAGLGCHIVWRSDHGHCSLRSGIEYFGDTKVTNLDSLATCEEHVLGFDVTMDNLALVDVFESQAYLDEPVKDFLLAELLILPCLLLDMVSQVANYLN